MRPLRLTMKGFGAFREHTEIDFSDIDLMALVGATGSGKSTVIDAMSFALYGNVARYDDNREVAAAINQTSNEARVLFEFELSGQTYTAARVVRRTPRGASTKEARLERGEEVLAAEARPMSSKVGELLGLDFEQFNRTVVLPQGKFADFLHDKPADRQTILVQLLGADLYRRIGQEARSRASRSRAQADALNPELEAVAEDLTAERRTAIETLVDRIADARSEFASARANVDDLDRDIRELGHRRAGLGERVQSLSSIAVPSDIGQIADDVRTATQRLAEAVRLRDARSAKRRSAVEAVRTGPDLADVRFALQAHSDVHRLTQEHAGFSAGLDAARKLLDEAVAAAQAVRSTQAELDAALTGALATERSARAARDLPPSISQIDSWANAYQRSNNSARDLAEATVKLAVATAASTVSEQALANCKAAEASAADDVQRLRHQHGVLGYSDLLIAGGACPLCQQAVHELPQHDLDTELAAALTALDTAKAVLGDATRVCDQERRTVASLQSEIAATEKLMESLSTSLDGAPQEVDLAGLRNEAEVKSTEVEAAEAATIAAEAAAKAHRDSPRTALALNDETDTRRTVDGLTATELDVATRLAAARTIVETGLPEEQLQAEHRRGEQLQQELNEAETAFGLAERAAETAGDLQNEVTERAEEAWAHFHGTRDRVAGFAPPATDGDDLSISWTSLADWARREADVADLERSNVVAEVLKKSSERSVIVEHTLLTAQPVLPDLDAALSLEAIGELLAEASANAASDLKQFDERLVAMAGLKERVDMLVDESDVAGKLGDLLRTDGFESWLMEAALGELVDRATTRLFELSGGQYSLEIHKRDFAVRDHTNADELRSARTLSGGETFLASLSLALALADATADLAPEGAPQMESIFLDEGFGTLDPITLDTVAAAIEELGAGGRLVGIVTHIRELADRMPVRLEVTKTGGSAVVERVEV